jgi:DNA polymerase-3 subunit alpha
MAFAQIEDLQGTVELVIFPRLWEATRELWEQERILVVRGKVSLRGREPSIIVDSVTNQITTLHPVGEAAPPPSYEVAGPYPYDEPLPLPPASQRASVRVHVRVTLARGQDMERVIQRLGEVYDLLLRYPGEDRFSLYVENGGQGRIEISFPNDQTGHCVELEQKLRTLVGAGSVRVEPIDS